MPSSGSKPRVLFLCTGNSARSQMAEGWLRHLAGADYDATSAGTKPVGLNPLAVEAMREVGIDISLYRSKSVEEFSAQEFATVITVCDAAAQVCPVLPGARWLLHWSLPDPSAAGGTREEQMHAFRSVRDDLQQRIREFLNAEARMQGSRAAR